MKTGAIILAAGGQGDLKSFRPFICVGQKPMIKSIVEQLGELKISPVVVVTGYRAELVERCLEDSKVILVRNRQFMENEMLDSVKMGVRAMKSKCDRMVIFPADIPLVRSSTIRAMLSVDAPLVMPECEGKSGHPVIISREVLPKLMKYEGPDGLRGWIREQECDVRLVHVDDEGVLIDVNDEAGLSIMRDEQSKRMGRGKLHLECRVQLAVDGVVMDEELMLLLEMIKCTGSIQMASDCADLSFTNSWKRVKNLEQQLGMPIVESAVGGKQGGGSSLTKQGELLVETFRKIKKESDKLVRSPKIDNILSEFIKNSQKIN